MKILKGSDIVYYKSKFQIKKINYFLCKKFEDLTWLQSFKVLQLRYIKKLSKFGNKDHIKNSYCTTH